MPESVFQAQPLAIRRAHRRTCRSVAFSRWGGGYEARFATSAGESSQLPGTATQLKLLNFTR